MKIGQRVYIWKPEIKAVATIVSNWVDPHDGVRFNVSINGEERSFHIDWFKEIPKELENESSETIRLYFEL